MIAVALFGPALLRPLVAIVVRPLRRIRVSGFLAAETVGADLRRLGSVLSPLVLAVGFTLSMVYTQSVLSEAVSTQVEEGVTADAVVTDVVSGGVGAEAVGALAELPETGAVTPLQQSRMFVPYSVFGDPDLASFATRGVAPEGFGDNLDPGSVDGDLGALSGKTVAMESSGANLLGADVGDELEVRLGDGTRPRCGWSPPMSAGWGWAGRWCRGRSWTGTPRRRPGYWWGRPRARRPRS